jgi:tetratricopeptide (TPR) repeat protein
MTQQIRDQLQATLGSAYTLERELGGGGMSRVFVAEETALRRKVVVKVLPPELTAGVNVERFNREILLAAKLQHPNIVQVLTAGETQGLPYYTMPLVEGESLRARLVRANALSITEAVSVLKDVARALAYAHERGIVHRDIKPDNVLITGGAATVTDFGIAKAISASRTQGSTETLTQIGTSIGTPTYMSPEQAAGDPDTDHRTDIYSFGCMAFELLAGQPPFNEKSPRKLLAAHMGEKPRAVTELRPDTPSSLAELVMRCLAKEADDRPQSANALVQVLETVTSGGTSPAAPAVLLGGKGMFRKALAIYAAAFVAVAILAKAAIVGIGLPDWVFPGSLIVMALGLPVILWTGYVHRVARRAMTMTPTYTPGGTPSTTRGTIATMALKAAPKMSWYRTARGGMYAFGVFIVMIAAFMTMRQFGIGPFGSLIGQGALASSNKVIIADFNVTGRDSTLGRVVSEAVRQGLSESSALSVMTPAAVSTALTRMQRRADSHLDLGLARDLAVREGAKAVIDGDIAAVGSGFILTLRLVRADSASAMVSIRAAGDGPAGIIEAADKATRELRAKVGESLRRVQNTPALASVTTSSIEALQKYTEAFRLNSAARDPIGAVRLAREAVTIDSTFAMAWRLMAAAASNATMRRSLIDSAYTMAYRYRERMTERERAFMLEGYYRAGPGRDRGRAIETAARMMALGDSFAGANNSALGYRGRRQFAQAESLLRVALRVDTTTALPAGNLIQTLLDQGRLDDAAAEVRIAERRFPGQAGWVNNRIAIATYRGDRAEAKRLADSLAKNGRSPGDRLAGVSRQMDILVTAGRLREAAEAERTRMDLDRARGAQLDPRGELLTAAEIAVAVRDSSARGLRGLDAALAAHPLSASPEVDRPYFRLVRDYSAAGRADRAKAILAQYDREVTDTAVKRSQKPAYETALAEIALAERRFPEALAAFRRGDSLPDGPANGCTTCLPIALARVFDAAGQADSAIVMFERYLSTPFATRVFVSTDGLTLARSRERLGQLYDAKGDAANAAKHYREFVELWKDADPELQPRVRAARERLAKLAPVEKPR